MGRLRVDAPERAFAPPAVGQRIEARLGPVTLVGVTLDGGRATRVWRAEAGMAVSYRVFLHALDASGQLVGQSDGVPAGWTRPTTGWLPGEYVTDPRTLNLPPGAYTLFAGMYDPASGDRLAPAAYPDGRVRLGEVSVGQ